MSQRRYLVTSALPYINGTKHLGNLIGSMLPADVYARYLRARGREVLFICATTNTARPRSSPPMMPEWRSRGTAPNSTSFKPICAGDLDCLSITLDGVHRNRIGNSPNTSAASLARTATSKSGW